MAVLTLDRRERALSAALGEFPHQMADLPVGDVTCCCTDGLWVAERKTVADLAHSVRSGSRACLVHLSVSL